MINGMHSPPLDTVTFNVMSDVTALEDFYNTVEEINNPSLQQKIQHALNKILAPWTQRQDDLINTLNQVEQSYAALQQEIQIQSRMYHKAMRDLQFYKAKCDALVNHDRQYHAGVNKTSHSVSTIYSSPLLAKSPHVDCRSILNIDTSSNISVSSGTDCSQFTKSSTPIDDHSLFSFSKSFLPTAEPPQLTTPDDDFADDQNDKFDLLSIIDQSYPIQLPPQKSPPSHDLPLPPVPLLSPPTSHQKKITVAEDHFQTPTQQITSSTTKELIFACGDGFWNTIAKGKTCKSEVDFLVKNYLKRGGQPNVANNSGTIQSIKEGYGLIHALIVIKNTSALQRIIEAGANPHALPLPGTSHHGIKESNNISPLVLAAQLGYMNGVRLLVERAHANVLSSKGPRQENALLAAIEGDAFDVVTYLLKVSHQLLDQADIFGAKPIHYACMTGKTRMISFLVRECRQEVDAVDYKGETPLHYAIRHRRAKAVVVLVGEMDAYPNTYIAKKVPTPLDLAKSKGLRNVADYLKRMGAKTTKEMEKKSSSVFTSLPESSSGNVNETCDVHLASSNYSVHSVHSGRTSSSNESVII